jgi:hypothetical protein
VLELLDACFVDVFLGEGEILVHQLGHDDDVVLCDIVQKQNALALKQSTDI